jgi:hypothetical protein
MEVGKQIIQANGHGGACHLRGVFLPINLTNYNQFKFPTTYRIISVIFSFTLSVLVLKIETAQYFFGVADNLFGTISLLFF